MKVISIDSPNVISTKKREIPIITSSDEVLVRIKCVGICGSDVHIFQGKNPFAVYPRVWGHEFTGEVVAIGKDVDRFAVGDHVVGEPFTSCGHCYACRHGRSNVCKELNVYGVHQDGGCQEYIVMNENKIHRIDSNVPWDIGVLAEPITIGFQSIARGRMEEGDLVLIMGAGTIGLTLLMAAKEKGAKVIITDLFDSKLEYAKKFGADYVINVRETSLEDAIAKIGEAPNLILDAVGSPASLEQAVDMVSVAGRVVELGFAETTSAISHVTLMKKEVDVYGTRLQSGRFPDAIRYIENHQDILSDFVTQRFDLSHVLDAFHFVIENPAMVRKALILL